MDSLSLQELTWLIAVITFVGSIVIFLFKKIVIEPLQQSINALSAIIKDFKKTTDKEIDLLDKEIDLLKEKTTRHDEQIKTLFLKESEKK